MPLGQLWSKSNLHQSANAELSRFQNFSTPSSQTNRSGSATRWQGSVHLLLFFVLKDPTYEFFVGNETSNEVTLRPPFYAFSTRQSTGSAMRLPRTGSLTQSPPRC